ncbi:MAG: hypothetical protein GY715_01930 [Planctomycetes bacterium]|nr:hypothetical protein [Planctomycetota bacterium]
MHQSKQHHVRVLAGTLLGVFGLAAMITAPPARAGELYRVSKVVRHSEQGRSTGDTRPGPVVPANHQVHELVSGLGAMMTVAGPDMNGFGGRLYVVLSESNEIVLVDGTGAIEPFADLGAVTPGGYPCTPTIDRLGTYGGSLFVADLRHDAACEVDPGGAPSIFAQLGEPGPIAFDPFGAFDGKLYAIDGDGSVHALEADGSLTLLATGVGGHGGSITFAGGGALGDTMFITDPDGRRIVALGELHPVGAPAATWADLAPLGVEPVSMAVSDGGPFGTDVAYVVDAAQGRVVRLAADGSFVDEFVTGLIEPVSVELPVGGDFAGRMIITAEDRIWVVTPPG